MTGAVWGIAMVKDEADIVRATVGNMLRQVDVVLVADNGSTDGTREQLVELGDVLVKDDPEVGYYQSRKMTALAAHAAERGASWVVPFDADEWWYSPFGRIADVLRELSAEGVGRVSAPLFDHVASAADDPELSCPVSRIGWRRREPGKLAKVACRPLLPVTIEQGNHAVSYPLRDAPGQLVVRHFPYRSAQQFVSKVRNGAAAYRATDLPDSAGAHWRSYGAILEHQGEQGVVDVFTEWFYSADPEADPSLVHDPVA